VIAPLERRLQLVTGKGGTGKTTLALALGLAHAARGKRPLVVELGHRASLGAHFAREAAGERLVIGHEPSIVSAGLCAVNVDPDQATRALVLRSLPSRRFARYAMSAAPVRAFLGAAPAVAEVATLDRLRHFVDDTDFDPILVDGDATGHARMLFGVSAVLAGLGASGPVGALMERFASVFADPALAAVHVVALPTSLAVEETLALRESLRSSGKVALGHTILNRVEGGAARGLPLERLRAIEDTLAPRHGALASEVALLRADGERGRRADVLGQRLAVDGALPIRVHERTPAELELEGLAALGLSMLREASPS
jgi:arsenite/tail-anchored protein-transporting ATPase